MEFDWHTIFFGDHPYAYLLEIVFRSTISFFAVVAVLRFTGKRGVQQLSIFEMVMIITLGSAAGDSMFMDDVGIFHAFTVFLVILILYRSVIYVITRNDKAEILLEGEPQYIIRDGKLCVREGDEEMGSDEFFGALRIHSVEHLGQVRYAILEDTGNISVFYFSDDEVKPGLPILPDDYNKAKKEIDQKGIYACSKCGYTDDVEPTPSLKCKQCKNEYWVQAISRKRIT